MHGELQALVPLCEARQKLIPRRNGRPVSPSTLWRWTRKGLRAGDGTTVRLEVVRVGGRPMTSERAVRDFFKELTARSERPAHATEHAAERPAAMLRRLREDRLL